MNSMSPEFKPVATALLQARVDGKLTGSADFFKLLHEHRVTDLDFNINMDELNSFITEITPCDIIPEARRVAEKYGLTITL